MSDNPVIHSVDAGLKNRSLYVATRLYRAGLPAPSEALIAGREKVASGWRQGSYGDDEAGYCAIGGMVRGGDRTPTAALLYLAQATGVADWTELDQWNDAEGRTQTDVLDAYDHAIKLALEDKQ